VFYGVFAGFAIVAQIAGIVAIVTGRKRGDLTRVLGLVAIAYSVLAQTLQSLWD
jgi:hypothetical protein